MGEVSATGEDQASIAQGYLGLVFKYGSEKSVIPQLFPNQTEGLEFWITNKIREIRDKADNLKYRIGVITGKDEFKLSDANLVPKQGRGGGSPTLQSILEQAFPFYKIEELDLKVGDEAVGSRTRVKVVKNKLAPPFREAEFDIRWGTGVDAASDLIDYGCQVGIVEKSGAHLSFGGEHLGQRRERARETLLSNERLFSALRAAGVVAGDRVAAIAANIPETIVAALGAASIGAVWSSCSPDFGVQGILDRFGQISPRVLITVDGYSYGGKVFPCLEKAAAVARELPSVRQVVIQRLHNVAAPRIESAVDWAEWLSSASTDLDVERRGDAGAHLQALRRDRRTHGHSAPSTTPP